MTDLNPQELIQPILEIAQEAGKKILDIYHSGKDLDVEHKDDDTPLTIADIAAHKTIPVLSEESATIPYAQRKQWQNYWLVDPLDGTREFIKRNGEFTVNIALVHENSAILGVIYAPVIDVYYYASKSGGAFKNFTRKSSDVWPAIPAPKPAPKIWR